MKKNLSIFPILILGALLVFASSCKKDDDNSDLPNVSFSNFTDSRDGKVYETVIIGSQEWMAKNLAYAPTNGQYWSYANDISNIEIYGYLYDWQTALEVCPPGWELPSDEQWAELIDKLGSNAGGKIKATGTIEDGTGLWKSPNTGANNEAGFSAIPGGLRNPEPEMYIAIGEYGQFWTATTVDGDPDYAYSRRTKHDADDVSRPFSSKTIGFSVRCIKE